MQIDKKTIWRVFLAAIGCVFFYWLLHETDRVRTLWEKFSGVLSPFVIGAVIAFILNVPMRAIEKRITFIRGNGLRRAAAIMLTFLSFVLVIVGVFGLLVPQMRETVQLLIPRITEFFLGLETKIQILLEENPQLLDYINSNTNLKDLNWSGLIEKGMTILKNSVTVIANGAFSAVGSVAGTLIDIVIGLVFSLYCLSGKETLARQSKKLLYALLPERFVDECIRVMRLTNSTFSSFLSGQCLEAVILGLLFAVAMAILKMPYISLISVLIALTALVPLVGAFIGCFFGAFFILVNDPFQAVIFVVMFLILQQIEGNLIYPKVVGNSIGLPGMWVLVAVTIGGDLMGIVGMLVMIPLASVVYALLREFAAKRIAEREIAPEKLMVQPAASKGRRRKKQTTAQKKVQEVKKTDETENNAQ